MKPLHCPQKCSVLLRVPLGICSFQELPQSILSLAAVHPEMVCFPTQVHSNWFRITKGVNSPRNGLHDSRVRTNSARAKSIKKKKNWFTFLVLILQRLHKWNWGSFKEKGMNIENGNYCKYLLESINFTLPGKLDFLPPYLDKTSETWNETNSYVADPPLWQAKKRQLWCVHD